MASTEESRIYTDENGFYCIDCRLADWSFGRLHNLYEECFSSGTFSDVDWVIVDDAVAYLVEYKNALVPACSVSAYNPSAQNNLRRLVKKCFDSLHFVHCLQRATQYHYVCVLEYALDDAVTRAGLRDELVRKINCVMSSRIGSTHKFVDAIEVVNIEEWNAAHTEFPIRQVPLAASSESADFS